MKNADRILEVVPRAFRCIRAEARSVREENLTVPQFRVMVRLAQSPATHKEVAEWMDVTVPTVSRMVEGLLARKYVRADASGDRRQPLLSLTAEGEASHDDYRARLRKILRSRISNLNQDEQETLAQGLAVLAKVFPECAK